MTYIKNNLGAAFIIFTVMYILCNDAVFSTIIALLTLAMDYLLTSIENRNKP